MLGEAPFARHVSESLFSGTELRKLAVLSCLSSDIPSDRRHLSGSQYGDIENASLGIVLHIHRILQHQLQSYSRENQLLPRRYATFQVSHPVSLDSVPPLRGLMLPLAFARVGSVRWHSRCDYSRQMGS